MFSVDTEEQARALIVATCKMGSPGVYYAPELAAQQDLPTLRQFSDRLASTWERIASRWSDPEEPRNPA